MSAATSAADLAMLLDARAIERVACEIDRFLDTKNWSGFRSCFADSIEVEIELIGGAGSVDMKLDDFMRQIEGLNGPDRVSFHNRGNTLVDIAGDTATLRGHIAAWNRPRDASEPVYEMWGSIEYGLRREGGRWRVIRVATEKWRENGQL